MRLWLSTCFLVLLVAAAAADEPTQTPKRIELPRAGLSLRLASGWTFDAHAGPLAVLTKGDARITIERVNPAPDDVEVALASEVDTLKANHEGLAPMRARPFPLFGAEAGATTQYEHDGVLHLLGLFRAVDGRVVRIHAATPRVKQPLVREAGGILRSLDLTPYRHPGRHVEWSATPWTIDLPEGWSTHRQADGVVRLGADPKVEPYIRVRKAKEGEAIDDATRNRGWVVELAGDDAARKALAPVMATFRTGAQAGPRAALPRDRFPRSDSPRVRFELPAGYTVARPTSRMRVVDLVLDREQQLVAAVFFFGRGQGGSVADNIKRWKGQLEPAEELPEEYVVEGEGVKSTVLDMEGTQPGAGEDAELQRMLAAVIEVEGGPLFVKVVAPAEALRPHVKAFRAWLQSLRLAGAAAAK
ncbi:MAG: hypothetical protein QNJ98_11205 [Planctomycetota bacterium]|nr:hypothetical protein [Planctomycetota bacterium]